MRTQRYTSSWGFHCKSRRKRWRLSWVRQTLHYRQSGVRNLPTPTRFFFVILQRLHKEKEWKGGTRSRSTFRIQTDPYTRQGSRLDIFPTPNFVSHSHSGKFTSYKDLDLYKRFGEWMDWERCFVWSITVSQKTPIDTDRRFPKDLTTSRCGYPERLVRKRTKSSYTIWTLKDQDRIRHGKIPVCKEHGYSCKNE